MTELIMQKKPRPAMLTNGTAIGIYNCVENIDLEKRNYMKIIFLLVVLWLCAVACNSGREIQVERVSVQLVRIDTITRESGLLKVLTWETPNNLRFTSIEPIDSSIPLGVTMGVLMRR
jgi:NAD dependent epimerase/dehydratase family enzyme